MTAGHCNHQMRHFLLLLRSLVCLLIAGRCSHGMLHLLLLSRNQGWQLTAGRCRSRIRRDRDLVMNHYQPLFIMGCCEKGYSKDLLERIFTSWWQYGGFAKIFPKCVDFGLIQMSYQIAYLKTHYPKEWAELHILKNIFTHRWKQQDFSIRGNDKQLAQLLHKCSQKWLHFHVGWYPKRLFGYSVIFLFCKQHHRQLVN